MERIGSRRAAQGNGDGTSAERAGGVRAAAVTAAVAAALAGCSVTVQPKNAAASRPLSTSQTPAASAASTPAPTSSAPSTTASPTPTPSDVDHTACGNVRDALATLKQKLETDKGSAHRTATDYRNAGYNLRLQANKTKNSELKTTLLAVANDYYTVGSDAARQDSTEADLAKVADASKPLSTLCGES